MPDDERDERTAELLEVEPLDDLARRRLVTRAMEEFVPAARNPMRLLGAAAVLVVLALGVVALFTVSGDGDSAPTAAAPPAASASRAAGAASPSPLSAALGEVPNLGDFGNLRRASARAALFAAADQAPPARVPAPTTDALPASPGSASATTGVTSCATGDVTSKPVLAIASGRFGDRAALVIVLQRPDGSRSVRAVIDNPCEVRQLR